MSTSWKSTLTMSMMNMWKKSKLIIALILLFSTQPAIVQADAFKKIKFRVTAYCHGSKKCKIKGKGITASGIKVKKGIIAADWKVLKKGTKIEITVPKKYAGIYTVEDTGRRIKGNRIDLWVETEAEATAFGIQHLELIVLPDSVK